MVIGKIILSKEVFFLLFSALFICNACSSTPFELTKEIEGEYSFIYPTGQVEILKINLDSSYSKVVYLNESSYKEKRDTLVFNKSIWHLNGMKIRFENWIMCNDYLKPNSYLKEPYQTNLIDIFWEESKVNYPANFLLLDEPYYEFKKVK